MTGWDTRCKHCDHPMSEHVLDLEADPDSDCYEIGCMCPGFEPRKDTTDG